jgi:hypothetical protein
MEFEGWVSRRFLFPADFYFPQIFADETQIARSAFGLGVQWSLRDGFPADFYFPQVFISRRFSRMERRLRRVRSAWGFNGV